MRLTQKRHATILKHHRHSSVYIDGRYLHVDTKVSMRSKRGRELARETARAILSAVAQSENRAADKVSPRDTSDAQV